ncbi:MAG: 50S ribosomal protein L11 methyltransferase [Deltaproteobacteria bacterium]|nr:50S ribosomal protein L11 methyltransferase [Deltaproteobacteria bacterium]
MQKQHDLLLRDRVRMAAYAKAIRAVVRPGDVVADLGTGTGALAFLALAAGAAHVHAVEVEPRTLAIARAEAQRRGVADRITFYAGLAQRVRPRTRVDVVITETLGNLGLNENIAAVLADAKQRWLKPRGRVIPQAITLTVAPLRSMPRRRRYASGGIPSVAVTRQDLIGPPVNLGGKKSRTLLGGVIHRQGVWEGRCRVRITSSGQIVGFAGWFTVWLTDTISFTTAPSATATHWGQALLPLRAPIAVRAGQRIALWLEIAPDPSGLQSSVSYDLDLQPRRQVRRHSSA